MNKEIYHVLNRGVDKRSIFLDEKDYFRFIHNIFEFNDINPACGNNYHFHQSFDIGCRKIERKKRKLLVIIHAFVLMPNHYHILLSPAVENGIPQFMKKLNMGYSKYFNEKNNRVGTLFQGKYKSILVENNRHFLFLPFYIHFNPLDLHAPEWRKRGILNEASAKKFLKSYRWSSHLDYLGENNFPSLTQRNFLSDFFGGAKGYEKIFNTELKNFSIAEFNDSLLE